MRVHHLAPLALAVVAFASPGTTAVAQVTANDQVTTNDDAVAAPLDAITAYLEKQVDRQRYGGAVALVWHEGEEAAAAVVGEGGEGRAMERDAIFRIYSMSKPITAVAAMILVEEEKLDLDAPVSKYIPEFADVKVGVREGRNALALVDCERPMTVRDLCAHTSGLTYGFFGNSEVDKRVRAAQLLRPSNTNEEMAAAAAKVPLKYQPGTRFEYGVSSDVLGRVVEVASGTSLGAFVEERVFGPLGMVDTGFNVPAEDLGRVADCSVRRGRELRKAGRGAALDPARKSALHSGGGGLYSTADDYLRFARMLLGGGQLGDARILEEESVRAMFSDQLEGKPAPMLAMTGGAFGLGVGLVQRKREAKRGPRNGTAFWGGIAGTGFWVDPESGMAGVFMIQVMNESSHSMGFRSVVYGELAGR